MMSQNKILIKVLTNLFEFYADNSASIVEDRKNRKTIKTGRPNKFLLQQNNKEWSGLELGQQKQKKDFLRDISQVKQVLRACFMKGTKKDLKVIPKCFTTS